MANEILWNLMALGVLHIVATLPAVTLTMEEMWVVIGDSKHASIRLASIIVLKENINSLAHEKCDNDFTGVFFKRILWIDILSTSCGIVLEWGPQNPTGDKPILVQVMAWCCQATSPYLSQWWLRSILPYTINRPHCVKRQNVIT